MHPILFEIGGLRIGAYGFMLALAFLAADILFRREMRRRGESLALATRVFVAAVVGGIFGGKLMYLLTHPAAFLADPLGVLFSAQGMAAYGGFILAIVLCSGVIRRSGSRLSVVYDAAAPSLALAYGIARIGCQLAGDGCYGVPSDLPWAMSYPNGILPTSEQVHPTPVYEMLYSFGLFALLWRLRVPMQSTPFALFFTWLFLAGAGRFAVEFIRLNEQIAFGLTASQLVALAAMGAALAWFAVRKNRRQEQLPE
jgi:phosphatidylglycerol:prolipoprotein diacylglycerol transferase